MKKFRPLALGAAASAAVALGATGVAAPAFADVTSPNIIQPTAGATQINLIGFNDFHGRINDADRFAANVLAAQAPYGEAGTIILGNGDQVGASVFESAVQNDEPSIKALNALGVESFTQGNHEFDKGAADATGRIQAATNGPDLAANVTDASGAHPFGEYATFQVNGISVAVIGAVTAEVPSLVSPDGIKGYTFEDPVAAVNRVAATLSDGDAANGEAQVIVASYHDGAPLAGNDKLTQNLTNSNFAHMVNDTSPKVAAIFNAHTHMPYAYETGASKRPVIQADAYAASIAQVVLTVDAAGQVTASSSSVIPTPKAVPAELATDSRIVAIQQIMKDAKATADVLGAEVLATQDADLTRAKQCEPGTLKVAADGSTSGCTVTVSDDRANESALGGVVANSMVDSVRATGRPVDFAFMNPGGLRADILNNDKQVTYKEAASVLPFANTLSYLQLTGADVKAILEEQWQPATASRSYLQLGISDDLTYTYDPSRPAGSRITSMAFQGQSIDPATTFNVVVPNFLAAGGDNFVSFKKASSVADSGLIDLESFVKWVKSKGVLPTDKARNGVEVTGIELGADRVLKFTAKKFDLGSLGYIQNQKVTATLEGGQLTAPVSLGDTTIAADAPNTANFALKIPAEVPAGAYAVKLAFANSDTTVTFYVEMTSPGITRTAGTNRYDTAIKVSQQYGIVGNPVIITTGQNYADALAAGPAAGKLDASLLLTLPDRAPEGLVAEVKRLNPSAVYVIGAESSVSAAVVDAIKAGVPNATFERIYGTNRVETSVKIAEKFFPEATEALVATGWKFPDALSASSAGVFGDKPVILTQPDVLTTEAAKYLAASKVAKVSVVGGTNSVSDAATAAISGARAGIEVMRLAGNNRYETNVAVNQAMAPGTSMGVTVATGENFPDALVAAVIVDRTQHPLVMTPGSCGVQQSIDYVTGLGAASMHILGNNTTVQDGWMAARCGA